MKKDRLYKNILLILPVLFLLYSAPSALDYVFHFPDEKYYTDSVLQMMEKEDCFTPYQADGTPRFKKPIVTYWVLMGSYKLFGVSRFSSRIFFWLAGALLVIITFLMAKSISGDKNLAITTAFITASNPMVLMSASRSIPDILLVLFLTISAWGFLEIMNNEKPQKKHYWMAYLGAALAFETKGIPAAAFTGVCILYLVLNPWKKIKIRQLFEPFSMTVAVAVALSWFLIMYAEHGTTYLSSFFADQIGERVSSKSTQVINNTFMGILFIALYLIPWIIIAFSKPKRIKLFLTGSENSKKAIFGFIATWVILNILMSGAVFKYYDRYILPVIPLASLFLAFIFIYTESRFNKTIVKILFIMNLVLLLINISYALFIDPDTLLIIGISVAGTLIILWIAGIFKNTSPEIIIANQIMLLYFGGFILMYPLLMPNPGEQLVQNIREKGISANEKVYVYGNIRTASNIRIHSNNTFHVISMDTVFTLPAEPEHFIVFSKKESQFLNLNNYYVTPGSEEWSGVPVNKFPKFMQPAILNLKKSGTTYFIAQPKNSNP